MSTPHPYEIPLSSLAPFDLAGSTASSITLEQQPSSDADEPSFVYTLDIVGHTSVRFRLGWKGRDGVLQNNLKEELPSGTFDDLEV